MIIIEGVDNTGKSTLLKKILEEFPFLEPIRMENAVTATVGEYRSFVWTVLGFEESKHLIFDRLLFSEVIYGPIIRDGIRMTMEEVRAAFRLLRFHEPYIIYCRRTAEQIRETFGEREQMDGVANNIEALVKSYDEWMGLIKPKTRCKVVIYDFEEEGNLESVMKGLANYLM